MKTTDGKLSVDLNKPLQTETSQVNGSHVVTLNRPFVKLENPKELIEEHFNEYHLTARLSNSQLGPRELSLILEVLEYQIVHFGANFAMILALTEMYQRILGNKRQASEINNGKIRTVVTVAEILLNQIGYLEFSLYQGLFVELSSEAKNLLSPYLMNKRTYGSRYKNWRPEKFVRVRAVPVSNLIERPLFSTERYSGYTKGYGESHGNAHRQKTKPSTETDGDFESPDSEERNLIHRMIDPDHQPANSLWIKFKNWLGEKL